LGECRQTAPLERRVPDTGRSGPVPYGLDRCDPASTAPRLW
jgi:hypothetical protein